MLDPFVSEIQWSNDKFSLDKVVELFPLPQVVKFPQNSSTSSGRFKCLQDGEIVVLNSVRNLRVVRASDTLKNEYFVPLDSSAEVEVIWKRYKTFYDHVEELYEDFPAHVVAEEDDKQLGITKGEVLKLLQKISLRERSYLRCALFERPEVELNIPFTYKGVFKTLGDLTKKKVLLSEAMQNCALPVVVKFMDNKLKMKLADGSSRFPMALYNIDNVTLHEVIDYTDVIASRLLPDDTINTISIPLDHQDIEFHVPSAKAKSNARYNQFCSKIVEKTRPEMMQKIGIEHNRWIVFQDDDKPTSKKKGVKIVHISATPLSQSKPVHSLNIPSAQNWERAAQEKYTDAPRRTSQTFPRLMKPKQDDTFNSPGIMMRDIVQAGPQHETNTRPVNSLGQSKNLENESGYVTMTHKEFLKQLKNNLGRAAQAKSVEYENLRQRPKCPLPHETPVTEHEQPPPLPSKSWKNQPTYLEVAALPVNADRRSAHYVTPSSKDNVIIGKNIETWSVGDVTKFLETIGLERYVMIFKEKKVDGKVLITLNQLALVKSFNMTDRSHLETFLKFQEQCMKHERFTVQNEYLSS